MMSTIDHQENGITHSHSRFVFCSSNDVHFNWIVHALDEWDVLQQKLLPIDDLIARIAAYDPELLLLDFSGNCGDSRQTCTTDMITLAHAIKERMPELPLVSVGTMEYPEGAIAALRAGIHYFIDMTEAHKEASVVVRKLMTAKPQQHSHTPSKVISLLAARAGVGTTTLAVHLSDVLQNLEPGKSRVCLLDLGSPTCDGQLYLNINGTFSFSDVVQNLHRLDQTLIQTAIAHSQNGIKVISPPRGMLTAHRISPSDMLSLLQQLSPYFDVLIVDLGGVDDAELMAKVALASDHTWLVSDQSVGSLVSLSTLLKELNKHGLDKTQCSLVLNRYDDRYGMNATKIAERFDLSLSAVMPDSSLRLISSANLGKLLHEASPQDPYARAIQVLAKKLIPTNTSKPQTGKLRTWMQRILFSGKNKR